MKQHHDHKAKPHYYIGSDHILVGGVIGDDAEEKCPEEWEKPADDPETKAGMLHPEQEQKNGKKYAVEQNNMSKKHADDS